MYTNGFQDLNFSALRMGCMRRPELDSCNEVDMPAVISKALGEKNVKQVRRALCQLLYLVEKCLLDFCNYCG